jgi:hypothetical protein
MYREAVIEIVVAIMRTIRKRQALWAECRILVF